jgi:hypothetical protein
MKEKMKLVEDYMLKTYKTELIMSDMLKEVIIHDAYERYLYKPSEVEVNWIVCRLRFIIADAQLDILLKKEEDEEWQKWLYDGK